jgi:hypothetical protein
MALLALAAALLVGTASASSRIVRAGRSRAAMLIADAESRRALGNFVANWSGAADALPVGAALGTNSSSTAGLGAMPVRVRLRLQRLAQLRYALAVECLVGPDSMVLARRRMRVLLARPATVDSTLGTLPPVPVATWSFADLF